MDSQETNYGRSHVLFSSILFYLNHISCYFFNWHVIFFTTTILCLPLPFFVPLTLINLLFLTNALISLLHTWTNHLQRLSLIFSSAGAIPIFKRISSFRILSFLVFPLIRLKHYHFSYTHFMNESFLNRPTILSKKVFFCICLFIFLFLLRKHCFTAFDLSPRTKLKSVSRNIAQK